MKEPRLAPEFVHERQLKIYLQFPYWETQGPSTACVGSLRSPTHSAQDDADYCGLDGSLAVGVELAAGVALVGARGVLVAGAVWELAGTGSDFGESGTVVIALSGLSR